MISDPFNTHTNHTSNYLALNAPAYKIYAEHLSTSTNRKSTR